MRFCVDEGGVGGEGRIKVSGDVWDDLEFCLSPSDPIENFDVERGHNYLFLCNL